jgi:hypothetical protein
MEEGFVLDRGQGNAAIDVATWVSGTPESSFFSGIKTKGRDQFRLSAFLCRNCGYVEFRAMESKQE